MSKPTMGGNLPQSREANSLLDATDDLIEYPKERRIAIVEIGVNKIVRKVADGDVSPVIQLQHIELVPAGKDLDAVTKVLDALYTKRTGESHRPSPDLELDIPSPDLGGDDSV